MDTEDELNIGEKVFCANCGHSFSSKEEKCPRCGSKNTMTKSILWCDRG